MLCVDGSGVLTDGSGVLGAGEVGVGDRQEPYPRRASTIRSTRLRIPTPERRLWRAKAADATPTGGQRSPFRPGVLEAPGSTGATRAASRRSRRVSRVPHYSSWAWRPPSRDRYLDSRMANFSSRLTRAVAGRRLDRSGRVDPESGVGGPAERTNQRVESRISVHRGTSGCGDVPFNFLPWPRERHIWW